MLVRSVVVRLLALLGAGALTAAGAATAPAQISAAAPVAPLAAPADVAAPAATVNGRYIVVFRDSVPADSVRSLAGAHGRAYGISADHVYSAALKGYSAALTSSALREIRADARVAYVAEDRVVNAVGTTSVVAGDAVPPGVVRIGAATAATVHQASTVSVAVIDTGIDLTHPDLNAVSGKNCVRTNRPANDDNGHGSHVSGSIAARNNGSGVVGVAPGTKLYAVKVLNSQGSGTTSQVICGIDWVTANAKALNIKVASMSLGGGGGNDNNCGNTNRDPEHQAICRSTAAGVTYVVAAGNDGGDLAAHVPASYPEALTVSAMTDTDGTYGAAGGAPACRTSEADDRFASFSNYATTTTDANHTVAAPGVCIRSTWKSGGYNTISGTSMATPHVSGSVALCLGSGGVPGPCNGLTPAAIVQKMRSDAQSHATSTNGFVGDPLQPVVGKYFGYLMSDDTY